MIDLDFTDNVDIVRTNVGDPEGIYVSNQSIQSALVKSNDDVIKATILVMEAMLSFFLTQADKTRTGQVEYEYKKLYERYKSRLQEFQDKYASKYTSGIIIGGTSLKEINRVNSDSDRFTMWDFDSYSTLMHSEEVVREDDSL